MAPQCWQTRATLTIAKPQYEHFDCSFAGEFAGTKSNAPVNGPKKIPNAMHCVCDSPEREDAWYPIAAPTAAHSKIQVFIVVDHSAPAGRRNLVLLALLGDDAACESVRDHSLPEP